MKTKYRLNPNDEAFYLIPNTIDELLANGTNERLATTNKCHYAILNVNDCASYVYDSSKIVQRTGYDFLVFGQNIGEVHFHPGVKRLKFRTRNRFVFCQLNAGELRVRCDGVRKTLRANSNESTIMVSPYSEISVTNVHHGVTSISFVLISSSDWRIYRY